MSATRQRLQNVKDDIRNAVSQDQLASELSGALDGLFSITSYRRFNAYGGNYVGMYASPTKAIRSSLAVDREVFVAIANYANLHARTINVLLESIRAEQPRLQPDLAIVVHADPDGDASLRSWGREAGLTILPIYRPNAGAMPPSAIVRQRLARELFSSDSFQVTGPVSEDSEFFGRREQANEMLRQLQAGKICALFGLRKVGKTSMLNRIIDLASTAGSPKIAMIDCSLKAFNEQTAEDALRSIARVARLAADRGYAHVSQAIGKSDRDIMSTFDSLLESPTRKSSLLIVFDEVDYITPESPTNPHWLTQFNEFWREFRALVQEAKRHELTLSVLVSGVSSKSFRAAEIDGTENAVLHFVPEDYLSPFADQAADSMISTLANRCGLSLPAEGRAAIAETASNLPFWIRMVGSYIHRQVDMDSRPTELSSESVQQMCDEFAEAEGAEISRVALQNLRRVDEPMFDLLSRISDGAQVDARVATPLVRYGLVRQRGNRIEITSSMVRYGLASLEAEDASFAGARDLARRRPADLDEGEWAEELATISARRNILERKAREFVRLTLKFKLPPERSWVDVVRASLGERRRAECADLTPDKLMAKLYWLELSQVISREWGCFEDTFKDKTRTRQAFELVNERPDAHAKDVDGADIALQRRELAWLEERISQ